MKSGRSTRRQSHQRSRTPDVICLPAQKPPITLPRVGSAPRKEPEVTRALSMPDQSEPLVVARAESRAPAMTSRQQRRLAARVEAKANRRDGAALSTPPVEESLAPLPRDRSLAVARPRGLVAWLRSLVMKRPRRTQMNQDNAVAHLRAMRTELAQMQQTLDWMLEGAPGSKPSA